MSSLYYTIDECLKECDRCKQIGYAGVFRCYKPNFSIFSYLWIVPVIFFIVCVIACIVICIKRRQAMEQLQQKIFVQQMQNQKETPRLVPNKQQAIQIKLADGQVVTAIGYFKENNQRTEVATQRSEQIYLPKQIVPLAEATPQRAAMVMPAPPKFDEQKTPQYNAPQQQNIQVAYQIPVFPQLQ